MSHGQVIITNLNAPPVVTCPGDILMDNDAGVCGAVVNYTVTATDDSSSFPPLDGFNNFTKLGTYNGHTYYLSNNPTDAPSAFADASGKGGYVATINDAAENAFINNSVVASGVLDPVYIGLNDTAVEGTFQWQNGDAVTYTNWSPGEPNDASGNEDYTFMYNSGLWNDIPAASLFQYVLEVNTTFEQTAGLPSGSEFPVGTTT